jgi:hypothetical protein
MTQFFLAFVMNYFLKSKLSHWLKYFLTLYYNFLNYLCITYWGKETSDSSQWKLSPDQKTGKHKKYELAVTNKDLLMWPHYSVVLENSDLTTANLIEVLNW